LKYPGSRQGISRSGKHSGILLMNLSGNKLHGITKERRFTMYKYRLHWIKTGKTEILTGNNLIDACSKKGYDANEIKITECLLYINNPNGFAQ